MRRQVPFSESETTNIPQTVPIGEVLTLILGAGCGGAVGSISAADTMVIEIYSARAKIYVSSKNSIFTSKIVSSAK